MAKIAFVGKQKSGKSTLAAQLAPSLNATVVSFAQPLKDGLRIMGIEVDGYNKDRQALQEFAASFRQRNPNHWIDLLEKRNDFDIKFGSLIIDDMRFLNEMSWAKSKGFLIVKLEVSPETQLARGASGDLSHASEIDLDMLPDSVFDLVLHENTTVSQRVYAVLQLTKEAKYV
jgi:dephospho-CoA kinase